MKNCNQCGNYSGENIGSHWSASDICSHPEPTEKQIEVLTGLLMGDGTVGKGQGNPFIKCKMINNEYLNFLDSNIFPKLGLGVSLKTRAEKQAKMSRDSDFSKNAKAENYSDVYLWYTMRNPNFDNFWSWYSDGKKKWPESVKITPAVLKHLYCSDGTYNNSGTANYISIGCSNEYSDRNKVNNLFRKSGLPTPNWLSDKRKDGSIRASFYFSKEESKTLWEYMGPPPKGFEYKWPEEYRS